jgi:hypothetical protein
MSRSQILSCYGIVDRPELRVATVQEAGALWLVSINGVGDPIKAIPPKRAIELSAELRRVNEEELASRIVMAAERAHRSNVAGP